MLAVESTVVIAFAVGMLAICILAKLLKWPVKLFMNFVSNSVVGALMLCLVNLFGLAIEITIMKAFFAGLFGVPGVIAIVVWEKFL